MSVLIRIASRVKKLHHGEDATAMTEFVIGLPVFILLFVGIINLQMAGSNSIIVKGVAHQKMWRKAIDVQTGYVPDWSVNPALAAGHASWFHSQTGGSALDYALDAGDGAAAALGLSGGIMANSYSRVKPIDFVENVGAYDGRITYDLNAEYLVSESDSVTNALMNDAMDYGSFSSITGNGVLGGLNSVVDFVGMRPAVAGGVRYGISGDWHEQSVNLIGMPETTYYARSHVANAPRPTSRYITFAVVRLAMEKDSHYTTAIDFDWKPEFEDRPDYNMGSDELTDIEDCQAANAEAEAAGEDTTDCGEPSVSDDADSARDEFWGQVGDQKGSFP